MDYNREIVRSVDDCYKFDVELARMILTERARDLDEGLSALRECTRIGRDILELEVTI